MTRKSVVDAGLIVGTGFPPDEGQRLAQALLGHPIDDWREPFTVNLSSCTPGLLISAFFNGFLQEVFDVNHEYLRTARKTEWLVAFPFQRDNISRWMKDFKPYSGVATSRSRARGGAKIVAQ